ncbi:MAG: hypothetical protein AAFQ91_33200, partial [Cyanobacteria bacterium J06621_15]
DIYKDKNHLKSTILLPLIFLTEDFGRKSEHRANYLRVYKYFSQASKITIFRGCAIFENSISSDY